MNLPHSLSLVIQKTHSLSKILDRTVELIVESLKTDVCSIYLLDPRTRKLELRATVGLDPSAVGRVQLELGQGLTGLCVEEMRPVSVADGTEHPGFLYFPETREEQFKSFLGVPLALGSRPVGAIVVQSREARDHEQSEIATLTTMAAQLVGVVENARLIDALDRGDAGSDYLRGVLDFHRPPKVHESHKVDCNLRGHAASPGIAIATAVVRGGFDLRPEDLEQEFRGVEEEKESVRTAIERTGEDILRTQKIAEQQADEEHALIFSSHLLLLNDPVLLQMIDGLIEKETSAPVAVDRSLGEFQDRLRKVDVPYLQERIEDILDLRDRLLAHLIERDDLTPNVSDRIVISKRTPPSLVVELKAKGARGLVTAFGGATSHGALLARSMGIPAVTGVADVTSQVRSGDSLIVDGDAGLIIVRPTAKTTDSFEERSKDIASRLAANQKFCTVPARTRDARPVRLLANIGVAADLPVALSNGAEGVGLYRTEFPFILRDHFPTRDEQIRIYAKAYAAFENRPIVFRLLDLGADKFISGGGPDVDRNPFSGYRAIRVLLDHPEILRIQVQAFALAAGQRELRILVPLVSSVSEFANVRALIEESLQQLPPSQAQTKPEIGAMIELPAAVDIARSLAKICDFFSIGTNDLIQYSLAVDRENSLVASDKDSYHPSILRMIQRTVQGAHSENRHVSVCGELASNWRLALLLLGIGVDSLSVTPAAILELKRALSLQRVDDMEQRVDGILSLPDAQDVEEELNRLLPDVESW